MAKRTKTYSIGSETNRFKGTFDGNKHTISGFYQYKPTFNQTYGAGLFSALDNATVKDLTVEVRMINTAGVSCVGAIAGEGYGVVSFENVTVTAEENYGGSITGFGKVGGLLGMANGDCTVNIKNCNVKSSVNVKGAYNVGGFVGLVSAQTVVNIDNSNTEATLANEVSSSYGSYSDFTFAINGSSTTAKMFEKVNDKSLDSSVAKLYSRLISPEPAATKDGASEANYTVQSYAVNE